MYFLYIAHASTIHCEEKHTKKHKYNTNTPWELGAALPQHSPQK